MLKLAPKFGDQNTYVPNNLVEYLRGEFEIQMCGKSLSESWERCVSLIGSIYAVKPVRHVVLHMPFGLHVFEVYMMSKRLYSDLLVLMSKVKNYSMISGIQFDLLFHQEISTEFLKISGGLDFINNIDAALVGSNVYLMVENALPCLNTYVKTHVQAFDLFRELDNDRIHLCVDVCHARCYENVLGVQFIVPDYMRDAVKWVHFSATLNGDGYRNHCTHGKTHSSCTDVKLEVCYLEVIGIDLSVSSICSEISEADYTLRPDMLKELFLLDSVSDDYNSHYCCGVKNNAL